MYTHMYTQVVYLAMKTHVYTASRNWESFLPEAHFVGVELIRIGLCDATKRKLVCDHKEQLLISPAYRSAAVRSTRVVSHSAR